MLSGEVKSRVAQAMALLTPVERVAFTMRHMDGQSIAEISQVLGLKASAAKNNGFRLFPRVQPKYAHMGHAHTT